MLARRERLGTCGWDNVGRWTTRNPTRGHLTRVPTVDSDSTSKRSPTVFGATCRLGHPATGWSRVGNNLILPAQPAGETISGPGWARRQHRRQLTTDKEQRHRTSGGRPPTSAATPPFRYAGSKGHTEDSDADQDRGAAPQRTHMTTAWTHHPADAHSNSGAQLDPVGRGLPPPQGYLLTRGIPPKVRLVLERARRTCQPCSSKQPTRRSGSPRGPAWAGSTQQQDPAKHGRTLPLSESQP